MMNNLPVILDFARPPSRVLRRFGVAIASAAMVLAPVTAAHAQLGGGGGGTVLGSAVNYFKTNIAADLGTLAVIAVGLFMLSMRISWMIIIGVCAGIELIFNAGTIAGALHG